MFRLIKQLFFALLSFNGSLGSMANVSNFTTCISLSKIFKGRTQCFSEKFKLFFKTVLFFLKRSFQGIFSCFEILNGSA